MDCRYVGLHVCKAFCDPKHPGYKHYNGGRRRLLMRPQQNLQAPEILPSPELPANVELIDLGVFGTGESKIEVTVQDGNVKDPEQDLEAAVKLMQNPAVLKKELESEGLTSPNVPAAKLETMPLVANTLNSAEDGSIIVGVVLVFVVLSGLVVYGYYRKRETNQARHSTSEDIRAKEQRPNLAVA